MTPSDTLKSEDCLYLNVYAPEHAQDCPVFVWIYGGANHMGAASDPAYDLSAFAKKGIVGVSFNYRLGPLGFYNFHNLDASMDSNCGISDMIAALKWVRENIERFGGNPDNVTICGESAGGTAVYALLAAPSASGLFQQAIAMSGLPGNVTSQLTHDLNNKLFFDAIGITEENIGTLRSASFETLLKGAQAVYNNSNKAHQGIFETGPVIDDLVPDYPWNMLEQGNAKEVKCLFGTCENEGGLFYLLKSAPVSWDDIRECLKINNREDAFDRFRQVYAGLGEKQLGSSLVHRPNVLGRFRKMR